MRGSGSRNRARHQVVEADRLQVIPPAAPVADGFSLVVGGPFYDALRRVGLVEPAPNIRRRVLVFFLLTWFPLLALALLNRTAYGDHVTIPLLRDFSVYGRFCVALPLLIIAEAVIDPGLRRVVTTFDRSGIITDADLPAYRSTLERVGRLRDSGLAELLLLLVAFFPFFLLGGAAWTTPGVTTWHGGGAGPSVAGWWFACVSSPLIRFLLLRWLWRGVLWAALLYRITRLRLRLMPTHPDLLGGLGFILAAHRHFGILFAAIGAVLAGEYANSIAYLGVRLVDIRTGMLVYVCLSVILVLCPLIFFTPRLAAVRRDGISRYGQVGRELTEAFDAKWARGPRRVGHAMLGDQDPSSLIDYADSFKVIGDMRVLLISRELTLQVAAEAAAPLALLWVAATPLDRIIAGLVKMVV